MKVTILCSDVKHPVFPYLLGWVELHGMQHEVTLCQSRAELTGGDLLFLISCSEIIRQHERDMYRSALVIHASDLPTGRGWSPHIWSILEGQDHMVVTLLEAGDKVDSGAIWHQLRVPLAGHELWDEINSLLFEAEIELMDFALENFDVVKPYPQSERAATYYRKREPADSRLDTEKTIAEQFNQLRVADPKRFPAYFELRGHTYVIEVRKKIESEKENGINKDC